MPPDEITKNGVEIIKGEKSPDERQVMSAEYYEGIIPHPRLMKEWDEVVPGSAKSIFTRFEEQSKHRIQIEEQMVRANNFKQYIGPVFAFIIAMTTIVGGIFVAIKIPTIAGTLVGGILTMSGLGAVITPFLYNELKKKDKE